MDLLSLVGPILGLACVTIAMLLDGGSLGSLMQLPALIIVGGGTLGAVLLQTPMPTFMLGLRMLSWVWLPPKDDRPQLLQDAVGWLRLVRRQLVLALDPIAEEQTDPFIRQGLRLVVDGIEVAQIRVLLEAIITNQEHEETLASEMYEAMGGYAPTIGILGAVIGLITVMSHLEDPSKLGSGIATAFVATVYGVGVANMICLPIANKLKVLVRRRVRRLEMITEAMIGIAVMEPPMQFEMRLRGFLDHAEPPDSRQEDDGAATPPSEAGAMAAAD
ncbi:MAG TPA: flagellar motor protein [Stellaceae bacterium]|nr:flagellar motor protein [Stellaceae bacterium]